MDTVPKEEVLLFIDAYRKLYEFDEIIPASALRGQNTDDIIDSIFKYLPYGPQYFDGGRGDRPADAPDCGGSHPEKALHALDEEIPHGIAVSIDLMKERRKGNITDIEATIVCERESHKGIIIGKQGRCSRRSVRMHGTRSSRCSKGKST